MSSNFTEKSTLNTRFSLAFFLLAQQLVLMYIIIGCHRMPYNFYAARCKTIISIGILTFIASIALDIIDIWRLYSPPLHSFCSRRTFALDMFMSFTFHSNYFPFDLPINVNNYSSRECHAYAKNSRNNEALKVECVMTLSYRCHFSSLLMMRRA